MPRSTKSRTVANKRKTPPAPDNDTVSSQSDQDTGVTPTTQETTEVTTATEENAPTFDFVVEAAPADYVPDRNNPGRKRAPSPFDDVLPRVKDKGWQRVPYDSEDMKLAIYKELHRAKGFVGLGLDLNETDTHVEFRARDLQKRRPRRKKDADGNFIEVNEGEEGYDSAEEVDDDNE